MSFIVFISAVIVYFIFFHKNLMVKLGFSDRDENMLFIGVFCAACISNSAIFISSLFAGQFDLSSLINIAIMSYLTVLRYRSL